VQRAPKLVEIIAAVPEEFRERLLPQLKAKPVRTASGIAVVAVMSKPHRCPHIATTGNICVYCPGGPDSDFEYSTQSYTGYEPTSMRAIRARCTPGHCCRLASSCAAASRAWSLEGLWLHTLLLRSSFACAATSLRPLTSNGQHNYAVITTVSSERQRCAGTTRWCRRGAESTSCGGWGIVQIRWSTS
jgi:hypothetical protein